MTAGTDIIKTAREGIWMKALLIGGTGVISTSVVLRLLEQKWDVTILTRGKRQLPDAMMGKVRQIVADIHDEVGVMQALEGLYFDVVCDFVLYTPQEAERDIRLFSDKTAQYVFISTASAYHKPVTELPITEEMPLHNPFWKYSDLKAQCENVFFKACRETGFPVTIVRPSHTYCERSLPVQIHGGHGPWVVIKRMLEGKSVPVACDGMTLWTATTAEDFAVYFCALLGNKRAIGEAFHITSDESLPWNEFYRIIAQCAGGVFKPCYVPAHVLAESTQYDYRGALLGDKAYTVMFDNSKVKSMTGIYDHKCTPFCEGSARSVRYFMEHPEIRQEDPAFEAFCDKLEKLMDGIKEKI